ncbi:hypothetical protein [Winogradskyella sp. 3972H.M.0a.05]|uniref:hypothetical protein n=1 Tax=Winogradskyella sp. 3972H.M.0a.05 TaxID=2950277 RepID=UPI0033925EB3
MTGVEPATLKETFFENVICPLDLKSSASTIPPYPVRDSGIRTHTELWWSFLDKPKPSSLVAYRSIIHPCNLLYNGAIQKHATRPA